MPNYTHLSDTYSQNTRSFETCVSSISMDYHHVPNLMAILGYSGIPHVQTDPYKHMKRIEQIIKKSFGILLLSQIRNDWEADHENPVRQRAWPFR